MYAITYDVQAEGISSESLYRGLTTTSGWMEVFIASLRLEAEMKMSPDL